MDGNHIQAITLISETGFSAEILTHGAIVTKILALNGEGIRENVVLAYENHSDYLSNPFFLGCVVGPVAGRTFAGDINLGEWTLKLDTSKHPNALHSGNQGFHHVLFSIASQSQDTLVLTHDAQMRLIANEQPHLEKTVTLKLVLSYQVKGESLSIETHVVSSDLTHLSITNHSYFNLSGHWQASPITNHFLQLNCSHFARLDEASLPVSLVPLSGSAFDFKTPKSLSSILEQSHEDVRQTAGIDHPFKCLKGDGPIARLHDPTSGRVMTVETTQPYVVIYSGNFLDSSPESPFPKHAGICFETQDLPNVFENRLDLQHVVTPEKPYHHVTKFSFGTR